MKILSRYIAITFLKYWTICTLAMLFLVIAANLFSHIDAVFTSKRKLVEFLGETVRSIPVILDIALPITVLLATMFTFSSLARTSELVAMRSIGMGLSRQLAPILFIVVFISALDYFNQNYLFRLLDATPGRSAKLETSHAWKSRQDRIFYISNINSARRNVTGVRIFRWVSQPFRVVEMENIRRISQPSDGKWVYEDVVSRKYSGNEWGLSRIARLEKPEREFPNVFQQDILDAHYMPIVDLYRKIRQRESLGENVELYDLEWYQKTAALFAPFVLVWFGAPLSQSYFRQGRASGEILLGILGCLIFLVATEIFFLFGKGGFLPPLVSAWTINLVFLALGGFLLRRVR